MQEENANRAVNRSHGMKTRVLVTGGAGYIGSHTCKLLSSRGFEPVSFNSLANGHREAVRWGPLIVGDIRDKSAIRTVLLEHDIKVVLHFAALAYVEESVRRPDLYYDVNVLGTRVLLDAMRKSGVGYIVFSSSCATYGIPDTAQIDERQEQRPVNPYGRTKLIAERMLYDYADAFGLRYAVLRYFNAAGCDPDGELVEKHVPETHLIPRALMAAGGFAPALPVYGIDYGTPDGTAIRDYVHVSDLAAAHGIALSKLYENAKAFTVNLGTGRGYSVGDVVSMIERVTGRRVPLEINPRRQGDPPVLVAATELASNYLRFKPQLSDLETIVRTAWRGILSIHGMTAQQSVQWTASGTLSMELK